MGRKSDFLFIIIVILSLTLVSASDVAYLYKNKRTIDKNVLSVFSDMNLSVDLISESAVIRNISVLKSYKIVYIGDERFRSNKIPISSISSIISNYYNGPNFGITDRDGVGKLVATSPLMVHINDSVIQVYTHARDLKRIGIPYYYIPDLNKPSDMKKAAGMALGMDECIGMTPEMFESYDKGDVIGYMAPGSRLLNGKILEKKLCYFGIVKSNYWTPQAREMFKECILFAGSRCDEDSQCPASSFSGRYCINDDIYVNKTSSQCINPSTLNSYCSESTSQVLKEQCRFACFDGECIRCDEDSDCDDNNPNTDDICVKPGTKESYCSNIELCGNGILNSGEQCDDGNKVNGDGCSSQCTIEHDELTCEEAIDKRLLITLGFSKKPNVTIINRANQSFPVGIAVYKMFDDELKNQVLFDYNITTIAPNSKLVLSTQLPDCRYQLDVFCGELLQDFKKGKKYGDRLFGAHIAQSKEFCI